MAQEQLIELNSDENLLVTLVEEIADREDVEPIELQPLYDEIDPEALNAIFAPTDRAPRSTGQVEFMYYGYKIVVQNGHQLYIENRKAIKNDRDKSAITPVKVSDSDDLSNTGSNKIVKSETYHHTEHGRIKVTGIWKGTEQVDKVLHNDDKDSFIVRYSVGHSRKMIGEFTQTLDNFLQSIE